MKYKVMIVEDQTRPRELFELRIQASERFEVALSIDNAALADVYLSLIHISMFFSNTAFIAAFSISSVFSAQSHFSPQLHFSSHMPVMQAQSSMALSLIHILGEASIRHLVKIRIQTHSKR